MRLIKRRGGEPDDGALTYHGSAPRRVILKAGGQAARISMAIEQEGGGTTRNHGRDTPGPASPAGAHPPAGR